MPGAATTSIRSVGVGTDAVACPAGAVSESVTWTDGLGMDAWACPTAVSETAGIGVAAEADADAVTAATVLDAPADIEGTGKSAWACAGGAVSESDVTVDGVGTEACAEPPAVTVTDGTGGAAEAAAPTTGAVTVIATTGVGPSAVA